MSSPADGAPVAVPPLQGLRAFVLNLRRRPDRREQVEALCRRLGLRHTVVEALDGTAGWNRKGAREEQLHGFEYNLHWPRIEGDDPGWFCPRATGSADAARWSPDGVATARVRVKENRPRNERFAVLGCLLGHEEILRRVQVEGLEHALVLEDDCIAYQGGRSGQAFTPDEIIRRYDAGRAWISRQPEPWRVLYLGGVLGFAAKGFGGEESLRAEVPGHERLLVRAHQTMQAHAYLIHRSAVEAVRARLSCGFPADAALKGALLAIDCKGCFRFSPPLLQQLSLSGANRDSDITGQRAPKVKKACSSSSARQDGGAGSQAAAAEERAAAAAIEAASRPEAPAGSAAAPAAQPQQRAPSAQAGGAAQVLGFCKGEDVEVWSNKRRKWVPGTVQGVYLEARVVNGTAVPANSIKVKCALGVKNICEQMGNLRELRRPLAASALRGGAEAAQAHAPAAGASSSATAPLLPQEEHPTAAAGARGEKAGSSGGSGARVRPRAAGPKDSPAKRAKAEAKEEEEKEEEEVADVPAHFPPGCVPDPKATIPWLPQGWSAAKKLTSRQDARCAGGRMARCYVGPTGEIAWHKDKVEKLVGRTLGPHDGRTQAQAADAAPPRDGEAGGAPEGAAAAGAASAASAPPAAASAAGTAPDTDAERLAALRARLRELTAAAGEELGDAAAAAARAPPAPPPPRGEAASAARPSADGAAPAPSGNAPAASSAAPGGGAAVVCGQCTLENAPGATSCAACGATGSRLGAAWACPACTLQNAAALTSCEACGRPRCLPDAGGPAAASGASGAAAGQGSHARGRSRSRSPPRAASGAGGGGGPAAPPASAVRPRGWALAAGPPPSCIVLGDDE